MTNAIAVVLFDLGGVLIELGASPLPEAWLPGGRPITSVEWLKSETALQFECGALSPEAFAAGLQRELGLTVSATEILTAFARWPVGLYDGAHDLLVELGKTQRLAALTNTNALHWPRLVDEFRIPGYFSQVFASHLIEVAKPDPRAFHYAVDSLKVAPGEILFFDDNPHNVASATALGIVSRQVTSVAQVRRALFEFGLLP